MSQRVPLAKSSSCTKKTFAVECVCVYFNISVFQAEIYVIAVCARVFLDIKGESINTQYSKFYTINLQLLNFTVWRCRTSLYTYRHMPMTSFQIVIGDICEATVAELTIRAPRVVKNGCSTNRLTCTCLSAWIRLRALRALKSCSVTSGILSERRNALNRLKERMSIVLLWVLGHSGDKGNDKADELVVSKTKLPFSLLCSYPSFRQLRAQILGHYQCTP